MLLQTNSYIVPRDKRAEHGRLIRRFKQTLHRLGCDTFDVFEQVGANWSNGEATNRFVQIMRFRDRRHQLSVQAGERNDPTAQALIAEFCELINFPYQQQQGLFAVGFYSSALPAASGAARRPQPPPQELQEPAGEAEVELEPDQPQPQEETQPEPDIEQMAGGDGEDEIVDEQEQQEQQQADSEEPVEESDEPHSEAQPDRYPLRPRRRQ